MHDPQRWRRVAEATPPRTGCPSCTVTQARRGVSGWCTLTSLNPASDAVYVGGRVESRTLMARRSSAASRGVHSMRSTERPGGATVGSARASRVPQREPACPGDSSRARVREGAGRVHPFGAGAGSQPSWGRRGTGCIPGERYPEELRRLARLALS